MNSEISQLLLCSQNDERFSSSTTTSRDLTASFLSWKWLSLSLLIIESAPFWKHHTIIRTFQTATYYTLTSLEHLTLRQCKVIEQSRHKNWDLFQYTCKPAQCKPELKGNWQLSINTQNVINTLSTFTEGNFKNYWINNNYICILTWKYESLEIYSYTHNPNQFRLFHLLKCQTSDTGHSVLRTQYKKKLYNVYKSI